MHPVSIPKQPDFATKSTQTSTPFSRGLGSVNDPKAASSRHIQKRYIVEDMNSKKQVHLDDLLRLVFDKGPGWLEDRKERHVEIAGDNKLSALFRTYKRRVTREQDRYQPFVRIANRNITILCDNAKLDKLPFQLCRNDPVMVRGSNAKRYPDCVAVPSKLLQDTRRYPQELGQSGPKELPFHWRELIAFFEFKTEEDPVAKNLSPDLKRVANRGGQTSELPRRNVALSCVLIILYFDRLEQHGTKRTLACRRHNVRWWHQSCR